MAAATRSTDEPPELDGDDTTSDPDCGATPEERQDSRDEPSRTPALSPAESRWRKRIPRHWAAMLTALSLMALLVGVAFWIGLQVYQADQQTRRQERFVEAAQRGALNLTTIDFQHADADVQRILDSSTGAFHDEFAEHSENFTEVVKKAQSRSQGTVTAAGMESSTRNQAQVLVAMQVSISDITSSDQKPRSWRMRVTVDEIGKDIKVSNVEFVP